MITRKPIAIYYEHPRWFEKLFAELDRRGVPYLRLDARRHQYDPHTGDGDFALVFNRMSPSAYTRGAGQALFYTLGWLEHLEARGVRVVNGSSAFRTETSKARQAQLVSALGLPYPATRVINHPDEAPRAAEGLRFPVLVKPNIGGSGAGIQRYDTPAELDGATRKGFVETGPDGTALVLEFITARGQCITRVEVLGGKYLYAIRIHLAGETYNLCPGSICQTADGATLERTTCPADAPKSGLTVEGVTPPPEVIAAVERVMQAAGIEVGGVESIVDDRDGRLYYYDINALSNFVADAPRVVGFDPFARLVDYLEKEAQR